MQEREKRPTLYTEPQVDKPYTDRKNDDNLISIPYRDAGGFYEYAVQKVQSNSETKWTGTYVRSTINNNAAETDR
jgi:hypothetical protein